MKGLRIIAGYVQARIMHEGKIYSKTFGQDSPLSRELAEIWLSERRKEALMGKLGIKKDLPSKTFKEAALIWFEMWQKETKPTGELEHNESSIKETGRVLNKTLIPAFSRAYDQIRPKDVEYWRNKAVNQGLSGTSANRYQAVLSSIFNGIHMLVKAEKIKAFKLPLDPETGNVFNPCDFVEKAPNVKRKRVLSVLELKALKLACLEANDADLWEICEMALKSLLRKKDLFALEAGLIDTVQFKTARAIKLPINVLRPLRYENFRKRWETVRRAARLVDVQFRDLRKTGSNLLKMRNHSTKMISEFLGHASTRTTEIYMVEDAAHLKPLADDLDSIIKGL